MNVVMKKLTSRKFLAAAAGVVVGISMVFGLDEGVISTVAGAVTAAASLISYITTEGKIDAASVRTAAQAAEEARRALCDGTD